MSSKNVLLVLIVRDTGLRSSLAARLGMSDADLLTVEAFDDSRIARGRRRSVVLVADQEAVDGHDGGCDALAADPRWHSIVLLTDTDGQERPDLIRVTRKDAAAAIASRIPQWRATG